MTDLISKMNTDAIRDFMSRVVPWPKSDEPGYINLHTHLPDGLFDGVAVQTVDAFLREVEKARPRDRNIYFCLSQQREAAVRNQLNATVLRAIWIDLDVGPDKPYKTSKQALTEFKRFLDETGLPKPSAMVASGSGGFHVYWFSKVPLIPGVWRMYAEALKALMVRHNLLTDLGSTADSARVLRVPGTLNWKHDPPKPVTLMPLDGTEYDLSTFTALQGVAPAPGSARSYRSRGPLPQLPARYKGKPNTDLIVVKDEDLPPGFPPMPAEQIRECLDRIPNDKVSWERWNTIGMRIFAACGGEDYGLPEWKRWSDTLVKEGKDSCEERWNTYHTSPPTRTGAGALVNEVRRITGNERWLPPRPALRPDVDPHQARNVANSQWPDWSDPLDFQDVPINEAVARVNAAGYFVLTLNGDIYKIEPGGGVIVQKREGFTTLFACRQARDDHGILVSAGSAWKRSPERREFDAIGYWPDNHDRPVKAYNLWQGWGVEPKEGDCQIIYDHILDVIANGNSAKADFILDFSAHMIQRSWEKPGVALVTRGRKGTGKTLLTRILARIVGTRNTLITANGKKLFQQFNWHVADKLLIGAEEAFFAGNNEQNDQLKHLITGDEIEVEQKFGQRISMKSMHRMIMNSNHDQVVAASDDERRFFVCDVSDKRRGDDDYFSPLVRVIKGEDEATLAAFMYELRTRDINGWKAEKAARNASSIDLARQKLLSLEPPLQWLLEQAEAADNRTGACVGPESKESTRDSMLSDYREWFKRAQVRGASDYTNAEKFWASIKRLLNDHIFPRQRLFRTSGGDRFVVMPARRELLEGFNRLLGGKVIDVEERPLASRAGM